MRKTLLAVILLLTCVFASGQNHNPQESYKRDGKTFVQTESQVMKGDQVTEYVWRDTQGNEYPIILHQYRKGEKVGKWNAYVIRKSAKTGKEYRYFLPDGEKIANEIINETK